MNKKGRGATTGFIFALIGFIFILTLFGLIEPFKEQLETNRDGTTGGDNTGLNCPDTPNHNPEDYANDTTLEKLTRRPTCFVTGISMVWFVGSFLIATAVWVVGNWRKVKT